MADDNEDSVVPIEASVPTEFGKTLRCCYSCRLIKTFKQFAQEGCENCENILGLADAPERVQEYTTTNFTGMIAVVEPANSWAAKWNHVNKFVPGCYALALTTEIPTHVVEVLEDNNIHWHKQGE